MISELSSVEIFYLVLDCVIFPDCAKGVFLLFVWLSFYLAIILVAQVYHMVVTQEILVFFLYLLYLDIFLV